MKKDLISIIVPIYNVEDYLDKCIVSILNQTYKNIEIILINDGSTDNSLKICKKYKKEDNRIKLINKANEGLSEARNTGITLASGNYISFIDSDDYIEETFIEKLYKNLLETNSSISACNFYYFNKNNDLWQKKEVKNKTFTNIEAIQDIFSFKKNLEIVVWNKLYKIELFKTNNIFFPKGCLHEDNYTTYKLLDKSKKISLINDKLYFYNQRENSITNTYSQERLKVLTTIDEIKDYFYNRSELKNAVNCYEFATYLTIINLLCKENQNKDIIHELINKVKRNKKSYLKNSLIPLSKKLQIAILLLNSNIYQYLINHKSNYSK